MRPPHSSVGDLCLRLKVGFPVNVKPYYHPQQSLLVPVSSFKLVYFSCQNGPTWVHMFPLLKNVTHTNSTKIPTENTEVSPGLRAKPQTGCRARTRSRAGPGPRLCGLKLCGSDSTERLWVNKLSYRETAAKTKIFKGVVCEWRTWSRIQSSTMVTLFSVYVGFLKHSFCASWINGIKGWNRPPNTLPVVLWCPETRRRNI